jgi:hypothetical protein
MPLPARPAFRVSALGSAGFDSRSQLLSGPAQILNTGRGQAARGPAKAIRTPAQGPFTRQVVGQVGWVPRAASSARGRRRCAQRLHECPGDSGRGAYPRHPGLRCALPRQLDTVIHTTPATRPLGNGSIAIHHVPVVMKWAMKGRAARTAMQRLRYRVLRCPRAGAGGSLPQSRPGRCFFDSSTDDSIGRNADHHAPFAGRSRAARHAWTR